MLILALSAIIVFVAVLLRVSAPDTDDLGTRVAAVVPAGVTVEVDGRDVFLGGTYDGDPEALQDIVAGVDGVGRVFVDVTGTEAASPTAPPTTSVVPATSQPELELEPSEFSLALDRDSVTISGIIADASVADAVRDAARRLRGRHGLIDDLRVGIVEDGPWVEALPGVVAMLDEAAEFTLHVDETGATMSGLTRDDQTAADLEQAVAAALGVETDGSVAGRDIADRLTALLRGVTTFETGSAVLSDEGKAVLDEAAAILLSSPGTLLRVEGHTDSVGSRQSNQILSQERAQAVVDYLVSKGVDPSQLIAVGFGETRPIADNSTEEGRAMNRRIEFVVGG